MKLLLFLAAVTGGNLFSGSSATDTLPSDITLYFYSLQNADTPIILSCDEVAKVKTTHFDGSKDTIILIHGYGDSAKGLLVKTVKNDLVRGKRDLNIIGLDWSPLWKDKTKSTAKAAVFIAEFLNTLVKDHGMKYSHLTIVGHSAGGPVSAAIGKQLKGQVQNIVGLDTIGIAKTDAKFVEYIHTSSLSTSVGHGHVDYFPNGGLNQTGCTDFGCNHWRAIAYYSESMNSDKFVAKHCDSYANFEAGKCSSNPTSVLGRLELDYKASGNYYLDTNDNPPYAKG